MQSKTVVAYLSFSYTETLSKSDIDCLDYHHAMITQNIQTY